MNEPVIIENLCKDTGMAVEEILVEDGIVVGQSFGKPRQPRGWNFLQRRLVGLMPDTTAIENHPILSVHIHHSDSTRRVAARCHRFGRSSFCWHWRKWELQLQICRSVSTAANYGHRPITCHLPPPRSLSFYSPLTHSTFNTLRRRRRERQKLVVVATYLRLCCCKRWKEQVLIFESVSYLQF